MEDSGRAANTLNASMLGKCSIIARPNKRSSWNLSALEDMLTDRLNNIRSLLPQNEIDCVLVGSPANRRYLSGFTGSTGWLIITQDRAVLAVDFRYVEQAKREVHQFEVNYVSGDFFTWLVPFLNEARLTKIGVEAEHVMLSLYQQLEISFAKGTALIKLVPVINLVESIRVIKEHVELDNIMKACAIADNALAVTIADLKPGISEKQLAWQLESCVRQLGSEPLPFEIIVASGSNSALPHHRPSDRLIDAGEPIIVDMGARINGYCSDMTRTFIIGKETQDFYKIYNVVMAAQTSVLTMIKPGLDTAYIDDLARSVIASAGYSEHFGHGLGHGIGLEPHENPRVGPKSDGTIRDGMVFTVEPGIYIPGWGGIRIEDTVAIHNGKLMQLTNISKEARIQGG